MTLPPAENEQWEEPARVSWPVYAAALVGGTMLAGAGIIALALAANWIGGVK